MTKRARQRAKITAGPKTTTKGHYLVPAHKGGSSRKKGSRKRAFLKV